MNNLQCSNYRGCSITTRWTEIQLIEGSSFRASYTVFPAGAGASWQRFVGSEFGTFGGAVSNAVVEARQSIDDDLGGALRAPA